MKMELIKYWLHTRISAGLLNKLLAMEFIRDYGLCYIHSPNHRKMIKLGTIKVRGERTNLWLENIEGTLFCSFNNKGLRDKKVLDGDVEATLIRIVSKDYGKYLFKYNQKTIDLMAKEGRIKLLPNAKQKAVLLAL